MSEKTTQDWMKHLLDRNETTTTRKEERMSDLKCECGGSFHHEKGVGHTCTSCGEGMTEGVYTMKLNVKKTRDNQERMKKDRDKDNLRIKRAFNLHGRKS